MSGKTLVMDLQKLQDEVVALSGLVETLLLESVDLLKRCDLDGLERLGDDERQIGEKRLAIEMGCLQLIASQQPTDGDLRTAVALIEIASELERVGEHAKKVARANCLMLDHHLRRPLVGIHSLASEVQAMLNQVMEAFVRRDVVMARSVVARAGQAEKLHNQVYKELLSIMNNRPRIANQAIYLSRAAYSLKRAAERITGICEWVVFVVAGTMGEPRSGQPLPMAEFEGAQQDLFAS